MKPLRTAGDSQTARYMDDMLKTVHESLLGEPLYRMNASALSDIASTLDGLGPVFKPESLFAWLQHTVIMATSNALFGSHNPLQTDPTLVNSLCDFNNGCLSIILGFPRFCAARAYRGRAAIQSALYPYYLKKYDLEPDVAALVKRRAEIYRKYHYDPIDIAKWEISILLAATVNTIPTAFWNVVYIASDPTATEAIRQELQSILVITSDSRENSKKEAKLDITKLESQCPILVSSYRETNRLTNSQVGTRRVMTDTVISDGKSDYLLRAGSDLQIPSGVSHLSTAIWGSNAAEFDVRRFVKPKANNDIGNTAKEIEREQQRAYFPFGGGKHLCPGRNFAFAEILGTVAALILGFDIRAKDGGLMAVPEMERSKLGGGVAAPSKKGILMGARITRREGWENVRWKFTTGKE